MGVAVGGEEVTVTCAERVTATCDEEHAARIKERMGSRIFFMMFPPKRLPKSESDQLVFSL